eukprot:g11830.t1
MAKQLTKQLRNFRITYLRKGESGSHDGEGIEWLFDKLNAEPEGHEQTLEPKRAFSLLGPGCHEVLVNLKEKKTAKFVKLALDQALGHDFSYTVKPEETSERGEKFVPGEREALGRCRSTIEREAIKACGQRPATFVLVDASLTATYSYDGRGGLSRLSRLARLPRGVNAQPTADSPQQGRAAVAPFPREAQANRQPVPSSSPARCQQRPTGTDSGGAHVDATGVPRSGRSGGREKEHHEQDITETQRQSGSKRTTHASSAHDYRRRPDRPSGGGMASKRARKGAPRRPPVEPRSVSGTEGATSGTSPQRKVGKAQPSRTGIACDQEQDDDDGDGGKEGSAQYGTTDPMPFDADANRARGARGETGAGVGPAGDVEDVSTQGGGGGGGGGGAEGGEEAAKGSGSGRVEGDAEAARGGSGVGGFRRDGAGGADGGRDGRDIDGTTCGFNDKSAQRRMRFFLRGGHQRDGGEQQPGRRRLGQGNGGDGDTEGDDSSTSEDRHQGGGAWTVEERAKVLRSYLVEGGEKAADAGAFDLRGSSSSSDDSEKDLETRLLMSFSADGPLHPTSLLEHELLDREYYCVDERAVWPPASVIDWWKPGNLNLDSSREPARRDENKRSRRCGHVQPEEKP